MSTRVVGVTKSKITLGSGKEIFANDNVVYTIVRDGLRAEGIAFSGLRSGDLVLSWEEPSVEKPKG
jgi:hypothetical protein